MPHQDIRQSSHGDEASAFLLAEFAALRSEIQERSKAQVQLTSLALIGSGAFVGVGLQGSGTVALAYPTLGLFILLLWVRHHHRIRQLGDYIKDNIEGQFLPSGGWEHRSRSRPTGKTSIKSVYASGGVIVGTQALAVGVGTFNISFNAADTAFLVIGVMVILLSLVIVARQK